MASKKFTQFNTANNTSETEISVGVKGTDNFKRANYLTATTNPTASNDGTQGYTVGSIWFNVTDSILYVCKSSATGAAVWQQVTSLDGTWTPSVSATNDAVVNVSAAYYVYTGGSVCQFSINFQVELGVGEVQTDITISDLPVSSTFTTSRQVIIAINPTPVSSVDDISPSTSGSDIVLSATGTLAGSTINFAVVGHYEVL